MNPVIESQVVLGVDIGGSRVRVGLVAADGRLIASTAEPLPPAGQPEQLARLIAKQVETLATVRGGEPAAVGVALPGLWDCRTGRMQRALNLPALEGINVRELLEAAVGRRLWLDTDVNAAAWGQWAASRPRPQRMVYLSLGTGVGGSAILDGRIVRHTRGGAGHFGFLVVDTSPDAPTDPSGVPGSLSAILSGPALDAARRQAAGRPGARTGPEAVMQRAARALAIGIAQLVHLYAPDVVALGGGVIDHHPELVDQAVVAFGRYRSDLVPADLRIQPAPLSTDKAGVIGAALLAMEARAANRLPGMPDERA